MKIYRVKDWEKHFETCETRKLKNLDWWPHPNKHDGLGFRRLAQQRDKVELYCAWNLICDIASKGPKDVRGTLARDGQPLYAPEMALMTGFPETIFVKALTFFSDPSLGWLIAEETGQSPNGTAAPEPVSEGAPGTPADSPETPADAAAEGKEGREGKEGNPAPAVLVFPQKFSADEDFMVAWKKWEVCRRGKKKPRDWISFFQEQINWLATYSVPVAIGVLMKSVRNDYQGLIEPDGGKPSVLLRRKGQAI